MRLPRVRFTVRGMMVVVAAVGVGTGIETMRRTRSSRLERAWYFARLESFALEFARHYEISALRYDESARRWEESAAERARLDEKYGVDPNVIGSVEENKQRASAARNKAQSLREDAPREYARAAEYGIYARKYERAARYPWLPVEPDPTEPK